MHVAVIGAGIVGVTTAYELAADGHQVTVFERRGSVAAEASFANAGVVAPGYVAPWAAPGMRGKALRSLFSRHGPVRLHPTLDPATLRWLWRWWRACEPGTWQANRLAMQALAQYSRARLHELVARLKLEYERHDGYLVLLRTPQDLKLARPALKTLAEAGVRFHLVDAARCREIEPDLNPETPLQAGVHLADAEVGNCRQFAHLLRNEAQRAGVNFVFHSHVDRIEPGERPRVVQHSVVVGESTRLSQADDLFDATRPMSAGDTDDHFDAVVVCAALGAAPLLRRAGLRLPLQPVYGYSITAPLRQHHGHPDHGPRAALMDERYKVAISRIGNRIRVAGSAEVGGAAEHMNPAPLETLYKVLHDWYPGAAHMSQVQRWKGARPMLPDGPPLLGESGLPGVWLNLGHGSSGWALACGSARVLADRLAGRPAAVDLTRLSLARWR
ncbi:D-amino acid dehydrogenase [Piscinibacter defluvii]|uniref:D-amino acid dehydrogenase n=1 Tax=Piscinibacter defluvii TaxID=1796922 RepID=UPI000FDCFA81|nr:D-amino acid dehydrogenase [Piscinibacter defluvii]